MLECILAIDLGTSGCKAALVDLTGKVHAWQFCKVDTLLLPGGGAEQNPEDWWGAILQSCKAAVASKPADCSVIAVCANTQGEGTLPVDDHGEPLCNAMLWMDTRGADLVRNTLRGRLNVSGYAANKLVRYIRLTGGAPSLTGKDPVGHMLYFKQHRPDIFRRTYKFLNVLDFVNLRLTDRFVSTFDSIATSWLTDNRDPDRIRIDDKLCRYLGIAKSKIPEPVPCTQILGRVKEKVANEIGLDPQTVVVAGAIDNTAAAVGSGAVKDGETHLYLGTSSWLGAHVPFKKTDLLHAIASLPCAIPSKYMMIALQATACGNLDFLVNKIVYDIDDLLENERPEDVYQRLEKVAAAAPPGSNGLIYTPWIFGERAPVENPQIRAGLHNLSLDHNRSDMVRAMFEGIALNTRWILQPVESFLGHACESITAVGGGASSDLWCQIFADVLNRPIKQVENPIEANARGSALIAAFALKKITMEDVSRLAPIRATYLPRQQTRAVYDFHFREFKQLYKAEKAICKRLNTFHKHHTL